MDQNQKFTPFHLAGTLPYLEIRRIDDGCCIRHDGCCIRCIRHASVAFGTHPSHPARIRQHPAAGYTGSWTRNMKQNMLRHSTMLCDTLFMLTNSIHDSLLFLETWNKEISNLNGLNCEMSETVWILSILGFYFVQLNGMSAKFWDRDASVCTRRTTNEFTSTLA